jgi:hypothetical protein
LGNQRCWTSWQGLFQRSALAVLIVLAFSWSIMFVSVLIYYLCTPYLVHKVASYEFTTLTCIPGVIMYKGAKVQVIFFTFKRSYKLAFVISACLFFVFNHLYFVFSF